MSFISVEGKMGIFQNRPRGKSYTTGKTTLVIDHRGILQETQNIGTIAKSGGSSGIFKWWSNMLLIFSLLFLFPHYYSLQRGYELRTMPCDRVGAELQTCRVLNGASKKKKKKILVKILICTVRFNSISTKWGSCDVAIYAYIDGMITTTLAARTPL